MNLINVPGKEHLGPAMLRLPPDHRAFVCALMELGGRDFGRAAIAAGFDQTSPGHKGERLAHDENIQAALREETTRRLAAHLPLAATVLVEALKSDGPMNAKTRADIAFRLLAIHGISQVTEQKITVTHTTTDAEAVAKIKTLAKELGLDPQKLLGPIVIDAEWTEIPARSAAGLEDLL